MRAAGPPHLRSPGLRGEAVQASTFKIPHVSGFLPHSPTHVVHGPT